MNVKKPIALITDKTHFGIQWAMTNHGDEIVKWSTHSKEIILKGGQTYVICSRPEDLLSREISDYIVIGGTTRPHSWFMDMIRLADGRKR
jgi:hypothetical protein